ncbi:hypothetical protein P7K49_022086 [Saguinus oedipus]|uniref:Uncharacterized protein n=1 Tax=Saguinus oedipus TaxID=9490 RepID=A0ABQ9UUI6_SAGOE|nr:hypothetical protein P7K49_022086 [Saguinus oedipus]
MYSHTSCLQEKRMSKATEVMMQYVENLKRTYEKDHAELMEFKKLANQNSSRSCGPSVTRPQVQRQPTGMFQTVCLGSVSKAPDPHAPGPLTNHFPTVVEAGEVASKGILMHRLLHLLPHKHTGMFQTVCLGSVSKAPDPHAPGPLTNHFPTVVEAGETQGFPGGKDGVPRTARSMSLTLGKNMPRRRVSVAVVPKFNALNLPGQTPSSSPIPSLPALSEPPNGRGNLPVTSALPALLENMAYSRNDDNNDNEELKRLGSFGHPFLSSSLLDHFYLHSNVHHPLTYFSCALPPTHPSTLLPTQIAVGKTNGDPDCEASAPALTLSCLEELSQETKARMKEEAFSKGFQEGLKKTKELQDLKEEEEEQKGESPEEPEEVEETEEEEKGPRSRHR